ncbi:MAG: hypothetical protein EPN43_10575 [Jatrophihabitans sp.]|nr:MAG: hypothetical protein EPN43_10575 [Jatrophihabitans sp.]
MSNHPVTTAADGVRNGELIAAEHDRAAATRDADLEYSETVTKIRERYEAELAEAGRLRLERVGPAHRDYNARVRAAEDGRRWRRPESPPR